MDKRSQYGTASPAAKGAGYSALFGEFCPGTVQALRQVGVIHQAGFVDIFPGLVGKQDLAFPDLHLADLLLFGHLNKGAVVHFLNLLLRNQRKSKEIGQHQHQQRNAVIVDQRLFGAFSSFMRGSSVGFCGAAAVPAAVNRGKRPGKDKAPRWPGPAQKNGGKGLFRVLPIALYFTFCAPHCQFTGSAVNGTALGKTGKERTYWGTVSLGRFKATLVL